MKSGFLQRLGKFNRENKDIVSGAFFFVVAIAILIYAFFFIHVRTDSLGIDAVFFPKVVGFLMLIASVITFTQGLRRYKSSAPSKEPENETESSGQELSASKEGNRRVILTILLIVFYMAILKKVGFIISSVLYLIPQLLLLSEDRKKHAIPIVIASIVITVATYCLFRFVFYITLPMGILVW